MATRTIHASLVRPMLVGGIPRKYAIVNGMCLAMLVNWTFQAGSYLLLGLSVLLFLVVQACMAYATKKDEKAVEAYFRHVAYQKYYPARAHPDALEAKRRYFRIGGQ